MNPGFNHTSQCTSLRQTNAESLRILHLPFAEILAYKFKQFLTSQKFETPLHTHVMKASPVMVTERNMVLIDSKL